MELDKYVGVKHKFNGDTFGGADCIGLCRLFFYSNAFFRLSSYSISYCLNPFHMHKNSIKLTYGYV